MNGSPASARSIAPGRPPGGRCLRRSLAGLGLLLIVLLMQAQAPPPPAAPVVTVSRSWYVEAAVVAVMFGLALFAVCRSSRRN